MKDVQLGIAITKDVFLFNRNKYKVTTSFDSYPKKMAYDTHSREVLFTWSDDEEMSCWMMCEHGVCVNFYAPFLNNHAEVLVGLPRDKISSLGDRQISISVELFSGTKYEMETMGLELEFTTIGTVISDHAMIVLGRVYNCETSLTGAEFAIVFMSEGKLVSVDRLIWAGDEKVKVTLNWRNGVSGPYRAIKSLNGKYEHELPLEFVVGNYATKVVPPETWNKSAMVSSKMVVDRYRDIYFHDALLMPIEGTNKIGLFIGDSDDPYVTYIKPEETRVVSDDEQFVFKDSSGTIVAYIPPECNIPITTVVSPDLYYDRTEILLSRVYDNLPPGTEKSLDSVLSLMLRLLGGK